ncbi:hypothetical protein JR316_0011504 [Psilocybe cubensis]|uniref:Uncharacterized protein n=1 Tax=Psilocybe cubensis TaxID=181762 RepID=A0ACB8GKN0_PSICU|nr:hypothetical protein JR316_0011504 [Psilocybe cubensis]KAH9475942.1 hypothetical protein JR316_0011504 [Psilocybe cubensis]
MGAALWPAAFGPSLPVTVPLNEIQASTGTKEIFSRFKLVDDLKDWPAMLCSARKRILRADSKSHRNINTPSISDTPSSAFTQGGPSESTLLLCLARNHFKGVVGKKIGNVYCASLHYQILSGMRGMKDDEHVLPDIPTDTATLANLYASGHPDAALFLSEVTPSHLKIPLHVALFISPILLFVNKSWYSKKCDREQLLKASKALGNCRPRVLREVEMEIWKIIAAQNCDIQSALYKLVISDCWMECERVIAQDPAFHFFISSTSSAEVTANSNLARRSTEPHAQLQTVSHHGEKTTCEGSDADAEGDDDHEVDTTEMVSMGQWENGDNTVPTSNIQPPEDTSSVAGKDVSMGQQENGDNTVPTSDIQPPEDTSSVAGKDVPTDEQPGLPRSDDIGSGLLQTENTGPSTAGDCEMNVDPEQADVDHQMEDGPHTNGPENLGDGGAGQGAEGSSDEANRMSEVHEGEKQGQDGEQPDKENRMSEDGEEERPDDSSSDNETEKEGQGDVPPVQEDRMSVDGEGVGPEQNNDSSDMERNTLEDSQGEKEGENAPPAPLILRIPPVSQINRSKNTTADSSQKGKGKGRQGLSKRPPKRKPTQATDTFDSDDDLCIDIDLYDSNTTLDVVSTPEKVYGTKVWSTYNGHGQLKSFCVVAHSQADVDRVERVLELVESDYVDGVPLHIARPEESCFAVFDRSTTKSMYLMESFSERNVVLMSPSQEESISTCSDEFYSQVRRHMGDMTSTRSIQDMSTMSSNPIERIKRGSLSQVMEAARMKGKRGKILNALDIPLPHAGAHSFDLSTEAAALRATSGSWKYSTPVPFGDMSWGLVATEGAFSDIHIDANGFCSFIQPLHGLKLWIIMYPRRLDVDLSSDRRVFLGDKLDYGETHHQDWIYEAIVLDNQSELFMRPNTLHMAYSISSVVCRGGHFYSSTSFEETLTGIIHCFTAGYRATNTNHSTSRFFLQQTIHWFYKVLVEGDSDPEDFYEMYHVPFYSTQSGYSSLIALCVCMILANALDYETYRNPDQMFSTKTSAQLDAWMRWDTNSLSDEERKACIFARGEALAILEWLCHRMKSIHYMIETDKNKDAQNIMATEKFHEMILCRYARMILAYDAEAKHNNIGGAPCCTDTSLLFVQLQGVCSGELNKVICRSIDQLPRSSVPKMLKLPVITLIDCDACADSSTQLRTPKEILELGTSVRDKLYLDGMKVKLESTNPILKGVSATPVSRDPSPKIGNFMEVDYIDNFLGASSEMEDDPPPKASKYNYPYVKEDYNGAGRAFGTGLTFMDQLKQDQFEPQRAENLYYPFASKDEWELSLFLLRSDMSVGMLNDFLKLELIKKLNLSYKSAKDLRNRAEILPSGPQWKSQTIIPEIPSKNQLTLFYRDGLECIKALLISPLLQDSMHFSPFKLFDKCNEMMRVYTEWFSGDIAHFMQYNKIPKDQLPKGATLVPPIISTDKTNISNMTGGRVAYPGLISIANIMMNFLHRSKAVNGMMAARLYHQCMDIALESVKQTARVGTTMADALGNNRFCFTPLAALIVDTPESALAACVAGSTSSVTLAQYETFGDSFRHPSRTADHTINTIMAINNVKPPNHLEPYLKESKKHCLNGVHLPFWRDWPLSDPSAFLTPEPLHHWHKMFWDHDAKWCIAAVGGSELDFQFSILQHRTGFRHFKEGISSLKQVTGREHRDVQRYIVALIADTVSTPFILAIRSLMDFRYLAQSQTISEAMCLRIEQALQDFHANKQAILDAGARRGKKNNPIDNFYIPKLEFLQSVVHAIRLNGCAIQWSADTTEHAHIEVVKAPSSSSNNQRYEPQVCQYLDRRDKLRNFDLFTAIREMRIDFRAIHSATITDEEEQEEGDEGEENGEVVMDTTSELLSTIMPMTTFQSAKSNRIVDYFYKASLYERSVLEGPVPYRTFSCSKNVVAHLSRDASSKRLHIDEVASIFKIPDLRPAIADYVSLINKESNPRQTNS